ncbi:family 43 glycosylhydrolase [Clostridium thermarum]|uniref:family 43 glycosylhydrolase n=1 Tax=Clostridium thermarum TaxID=1716543 RepID=UPI0013D1A7E6|nr:family 43 glycosylhydrolase [Clostridium thermarum]
MKGNFRKSFLNKNILLFGLIGISAVLALGIAADLLIHKDEKGGVNTVAVYFNTYKNSFKLEDEWEDYGIGDPYVLRFNGKYYLYCSTKDYRKGIKAWSSEDLISWKYEGLVAYEVETTGAYAPEVIYWNGYFYMYTSPAGKGHYVLKSEHPTGPFKIQTDNFCLSIDGSVFIDDDGQFYFTHAGVQGIVAHKMKDPLTVDLNAKNLNAYLNGWTEGSMIIKRNGTYFLTYTGNHVFSAGYRINYAVAEDSPMGEYIVPENNPIIINTDEDFNGLGHSSTVMGPDMDSYYIVYHNLLGHSQEGPPVREMNIDRLVFNGQRMSVLGPTNYEQQVPKRPDFYTWLQSGDSYKNIASTTDKGLNISVFDKITDENYTAEYNFYLKDSLKNSDKSMVGTIFSYSDESKYMYAAFDLKLKTIELNKVENGIHHIVGTAQLPKEIDFTKLHVIRIEKLNSSFKVFFDNMLKFDTSVAGISGGKIGYIYADAQPNFDYIAFTNEVNGSGDYEIFKPIPGMIEAVHFNKIKEIGYHAENKEKKEDSYRYDSEIETKLNADKSYSAVLKKNEWLNYNINVKDDDTYGLDMMAKQIGEEAALQLYVDGLKVGEYKISVDGTADEDGWTKVHVTQLNLQKGFHQLKVKVNKGGLDLKWMDFYKLDTVNETTFDELTYYGSWMSDNGEFSVALPEALKAYGGSVTWGDYELEADVKLSSGADNGETGIMFRVTNESSYPSQVQDSFMGYRVRLRLDRVILDKVNYGSDTAKIAYTDINADEYHHVKVSAEKGNIRVYINDMETPILEYTDFNAFMHGKIGIQTDNIEVSFKNIKVKPLK